MHWRGLVAALALAFAPSTSAVRATPSDYCVEGCGTALGMVVFYPNKLLDYYEATCDTDIYVTSLVSCAAVYCSEHEFKSGFEYANATCKTYSEYQLPSFESFENITTPEALAAIKRVPGSYTIAYNHSAIPDEALFKLGLATGGDFDININYSWDFGYACVGFWALVVFIGMVNRLIVVMTQRSLDKRNAVNRPLYLPISASTWIRRKLILPGTFGGRAQSSFGGWCTIPPRLETLLLVLFIIINLVFCFPGYKVFYGNIYYTHQRLQLARYVADRTGILALANFPAVWLFAARNDPFLWVTGWSFASYNRFHRWIARVATVQAIIHSIAYSVFAVWTKTFTSSWKEQYWYMGGMATITMSLMLVLSILWLRNKHYDLFLVIHIVLAIISLVAMYYHVRLFKGLYMPWIWTCAAIWGFDRALRYGRIIAISVLPKVTRGVTATATYSADSDLVRLDVTDYFPKKDAQPGIFYYVYEPGNLRGWESHPFTLCSWARNTEPGSPAADSISEKQMNATTQAVTPSTEGADRTEHTFLVRPYAGFTRRLANKLAKSSESQSAQVTLLLEGPYGDQIYLDRFTDVLVVAGGSGITAAISHSCALLQKPDNTTQIHIVWAVRQMALVDDVVRNELCAVAGRPRIRIDIYHTPDVNVKEVAPPPAQRAYTVHDGRPDIEGVLAADRQTCDGSLAMVCCGPTPMADACRQAVVNQLGQAGAGIEFVNDSMVW